MAWIAAAFVLGEFSAYDGLLFGITGFCVLLSLLWMDCVHSKKNFSIIVKYLLLAFCFWVLGFSRMSDKVNTNSLRLLEDRGTRVIVQGRVEALKNKEFTIQITLKNGNIINQDKSISVSKILISAKDIPEIEIGNKIQAEGILEEFPSARNPGEFDMYYYYHALGFDGRIKAEEIQILDKKSNFIQQRLLGFREKWLKSYEEICTAEDFGIYSAAALGVKENLEQETKRLYQENGISHILAISGLHISLIGMGIYLIIRRWFSYWFSGGVSILLMGAYVWITGMGISSLRAIFMFTILLIGMSVGRSYDMISAASLSAVLLLWQRPFLLFHAGFLLSFGAILGISLIVNPLLEYLRINSSVGKALCVSISVQLITLPITAYYFFEAAPYSILLNIIVVPLMSIVMAAGIIGGLIGIYWIMAGRFIIGIGHVILLFYKQLCIWGEGLPYSTLLFGKPKIWQILIYYIVLIAAIWYWRKKKKQQKEEEIFTAKLKWKRWIGVFALLVFLSLLLRVHHTGKLKITLLDVSQGDGIFIQSPSGITYLVDGGSSDIKNVGEKRLIPFFKAIRVKGLNYAIITHADFDHISGILELLKAEDFFIEKLLLPDIQKPCEAYLELEDLARSKGTQIHYLKTGEQIREGEFIIECFHPQRDFQYTDKNEYSTVLGIRYYEFSMLLTGDLEGAGEETLLRQTLNHFRILKVPHHGSKYSTTEELLEKLQPEIAIISCGENNRYGHPHRELLERLRNRNITVWITKDSGAVTIITDGYHDKIDGYLKRK